MRASTISSETKTNNTQLDVARSDRAASPATVSRPVPAFNGDTYEKTPLAGEICAKVLGMLSNIESACPRKIGLAAVGTEVFPYVARYAVENRAPAIARAAAKIPDLLTTLDPGAVLLTNLRDAALIADRRRLFDACMKEPSRTYRALPEEAKAKFERAFLENACVLNWGRMDIREVPPEIALLPQLTTLKLTDCENLTLLPKEIGQLDGLRNLVLSGCESLARLPKEIRQLEGLKKLALSFCVGLDKDSRALVRQLRGQGVRILEP